MAIYIKGVEKPINCYCCPLSYSENGGLFCYFTDAFVGNNPKQDDCPLIYIPEPHGRLIDESVAYDKIAEQETGYYMDMDGVDRGLQDTPTVIEGSE